MRHVQRRNGGTENHGECVTLSIAVLLIGSETQLPTLPTTVAFPRFLTLFLVSTSNSRLRYFPTNSDLVRIGFLGREGQSKLQISHACPSL